MRTTEECEAMLKDCKEKRDFWKKELWDLDELEELEYPHQRDQYSGQYNSWLQRVKTLEYVLGVNDNDFI